MKFYGYLVLLSLHAYCLYASKLYFSAMRRRLEPILENVAVLIVFHLKGLEMMGLSALD